MTVMTLRRWRHWISTRIAAVVAAALGLTLMVAVALGIFWVGWDWRALIGWNALFEFIGPKGPTGQKDALQVYAVIVAGAIAAITAAVGLLNLRLTRRNLEQQRELEEERAQGTALQAYYEQMGKLLTDQELRTTKREEIRELARGQTLTVLQELGASRKRNLLAFLHGAGLIGAENPAVQLTGADLTRADLSNANLEHANLGCANLSNANLERANLRSAILDTANLKGANLQHAKLQYADLQDANLQDANLQSALLVEAYVQSADLSNAKLQYANLKRADLYVAWLYGANLRHAVLINANLKGTDMRYAKLQHALLNGATMPDGTKVPYLGTSENSNSTHSGE